MLKCILCGHENEGTPKFCGKCGTKLDPPPESAPAPEVKPQQAVPAPKPAETREVPESPAYQAPEKTCDQPENQEPGFGLPSPKVLKIAIPAVIAVVIIAVVAVFASGGSGGGKRADLAIFSNDEKTFIIAPNGKVNTVAGEMSDYEQSMDGNKAAFIIDYDDEGGDLYYVSGSGKPVKVKSGVFDVYISDSGGGIAYTTDIDGSLATLNLYNAKTKKSAVIDKNMRRGIAPVLSPDGKSVFYKRDDDEEYDGLTCISINGAKSEKFASETTPIAVSNGGKYIYYTKKKDSGESLCLKKGLKGGEIKLGNTNGYNFYLNKDYTEIVFGNEGKGYISVKGGEKISIGDEVYGAIVPNYLLPKYNGSAAVYGFPTFKDRALSTGSGGAVVLKGGKYEKNSIIKSGSGAVVTDDGKWIYYLDDGSLKRASVTKPDSDRITVVKSKNLKNGFAVTKDGKQVYYVNPDDELYLKSATDEGDGKKVDADVYSQYLQIAGSGRVFYFKDYSGGTGELFSASGSKKSGIIKSDVSMFLAGSSSVFYLIETDDYVYDVYWSNGGTKFKKVAADIG